MLSKHSFNALLKTLEEPPPHIKFLLATTDPQKLPVTVLSRCLQFNLKRMLKQQIQSHLQYLLDEEKIEFELGALASLASAADGSMRDALSLLDQAIAYGAGSVLQDTVEAMLGAVSGDYLFKLIDALLLQDSAAMIREARNIISHNPDYQRVCAEMISLLQQIALHQGGIDVESENDLLDERIAGLATQMSMEETQLYYQILLQGRHDLVISPDQALGFEMLVLRLLAFSPDVESTAQITAEKKSL
jgi:DNA polymerase-3 subunit gamma/tau